MSVDAVASPRHPQRMGDARVYGIHFAMYRRHPGVSGYTKWCLLYIASAIQPMCLGYAAGRLLYTFEASRDTQASPRRPKCLRYIGMSSRHTGCLGDAWVYAIHPKCLQMISVFRQVARLYTPVVSQYSDTGCCCP